MTTYYKILVNDKPHAAYAVHSHQNSAMPAQHATATIRRFKEQFPTAEVKAVKASKAEHAYYVKHDDFLVR